MSTVAKILRQACTHHPDRESVGRCPECTHTYCRECITEHEGRVICAACLEAQQVKRTERAGGMTKVLKGITGILMGFALAIGFYYLLGWGLLQIPENFHEGRWYIISE